MTKKSAKKPETDVRPKSKPTPDPFAHDPAELYESPAEEAGGEPSCYIVECGFSAVSASTASASVMAAKGKIA